MAALPSGGSLPPDSTSSHPWRARASNAISALPFSKRKRNKEALHEIQRIKAFRRLTEAEFVINHKHSYSPVFIEKSHSLLLQYVRQMAPFLCNPSSELPSPVPDESQSQMEPFGPIPLLKEQLLQCGTVQSVSDGPGVLPRLFREGAWLSATHSSKAHLWISGAYRLRNGR